MKHGVHWCLGRHIWALERGSQSTTLNLDGRMTILLNSKRIEVSITKFLLFEPALRALSVPASNAPAEHTFSHSVLVWVFISLCIGHRIIIFTINVNVRTKFLRIVVYSRNDSSIYIIMPPPLIGGGIKQSCCLMSVCLSCTSGLS